MQLLSGTSGFSYKAWKGPFYPEGLPERRMLAHYAERLPTVEVNNTFYRSPRREQLELWAAQVPAGFRFVVKAPQRITHRARLAGADEAVAYLWQALEGLGEHLGPVLFQLPPSLRRDDERLRAFLAGLPAGCRAAFEFRHPSWRDEAVHGLLRDAGAALCHADTDDDGAEAADGLVATADWGYLRLRRSAYAEADLARWLERLRARPWREAYVFFKHEDEGVAPRLALRLAELFGEGA